MKNPTTCPSCGRTAEELSLDSVLKCDHCVAMRKRNLNVVHEFSGLQRVVVTQGLRGFQLFINGNLQFSSSDEFIYHEGLVHPLFCLCDRPIIRHVAILGGGDGLAAREVLRYDSIESVSVIDYDAVVTQLASANEAFRSLNGSAFSDPRVTLVNRDAIQWLEDESRLFDTIIVDFPDPLTRQYAELYARRVFAAISSRLEANGQFVIQATSRAYCPLTFWCIVRTIEAAGFSSVKYDVAMRSFGECSFIIGRQSAAKLRQRRALPGGLRFLTDEKLRALRLDNMDEPSNPIEVNESESLALFCYFDREWRQWVLTNQRGNFVEESPSAP